VGDEISLIVLATALFASTNLDDLFVLVGLFATPSLRGRDVVISQFAGIAALTFTSMGLAAASVTLPRELVGVLGLGPVLMGVWALRRAMAPDASDRSSPKSSPTGILAVAIVTVGNGGDNLAAYVPVFARRPTHAFLILGAVFAAWTAAWCWFAHWLVAHPTVGPPVRRYAGWMLPWVLMGIGADVLWSNGVVHWVARQVGVG
jgi:cadmium resistance protein CadD (predicted permease)